MEFVGQSVRWVVLLAFSVGLASMESGSAAVTSPLLDVFPPAAVEMPAAGRGETTISLDYTPSGSVWAEGLDERQVFQAELAHRQENDDSFRLRVGKGGQIYSLRGAFGESVPPSWRDPSQERSPWNDEVWQFVAVCTKYNGVNSLLKAGPVPGDVRDRFEKTPFQSLFFVHNSRAYIPGQPAVQSLYCPLLAFEANAERRTIRTPNWELVPQLRTVHRAPLLYYFQIRDVSDGIVELTWLVHNFSARDDIVFDRLNAPWGGTRHTSLPVHAIAAPEGDPRPREGFFPPEHPDRAIDVRKTGGWTLASATKVFAWLGMPANVSGKVPGVVLVHGGGGSASKDWVERTRLRRYRYLGRGADRRGRSRIVQGRVGLSAA